MRQERVFILFLALSAILHLAVAARLRVFAKIPHDSSEVDFIELAGIVAEGDSERTRTAEALSGLAVPPPPESAPVSPPAPPAAGDRSGAGLRDIPTVSTRVSFEARDEPGGADLALREYRDSLNRVFAEKLRIVYPNRAKSEGVEESVLVKIWLNSAGEVKGVRVLNRPDLFEKSVSRGIMRLSGSLPPFPEELGERELPFLLPISFRMRGRR